MPRYVYIVTMRFGDYANEMLDLNSWVLRIRASSLCRTRTTRVIQQQRSARIRSSLSSSKSKPHTKRSCLTHSA